LPRCCCPRCSTRSAGCCTTAGRRRASCASRQAPRRRAERIRVAREQALVRDRLAATDRREFPRAAHAGERVEAALQEVMQVRQAPHLAGPFIMCSAADSIGISELVERLADLVDGLDLQVRVGLACDARIDGGVVAAVTGSATLRARSAESKRSDISVELHRQQQRLDRAPRQHLRELRDDALGLPRRGGRNRARRRVPRGRTRTARGSGRRPAGPG